MAYYDQPLTSLDQNWGGDASTGNLRVVGDRIQALLVSEIRSRATNADMGNKSDLITTDKTSLVAAINEAYSKGLDTVTVGTTEYTDIW